MSVSAHANCSCLAHSDTVLPLATGLCNDSLPQGQSVKIGDDTASLNK
jgi:hypothetical protein